MIGVDQPTATDYRGIIDAVRSRGSVHYAKEVIPGEFTDWRREVRRAARTGEVSVIVIRSKDLVIGTTR